MSNPKNRRSIIIKAVIKGLLKSLSLSALVMGPGLALLVMGFPVPGMIGLFFGSFWMMSRTYKRPWRMTTFSCFVPPVVAVASYFLQLWLFAGSGLSVIAVGIAVGLGVFIGWWRGRSHELYWNDGSLFAKRTFGYLLSWVLAYGFTQALSMTATSVLLIRAGLLTGAFTTSLLVMVSLMLVRQRKIIPAVPMTGTVGMMFVAGIISTALFISSPAWTQYSQYQDPNDPVVQELNVAIESGVAADLFGAALATGLNNELGLIDLQQVENTTGEADTQEFAGFKISAAMFKARTAQDNLEITFLIGAGQSTQTRLFVEMFAPSLLDKFHAWVLSAASGKDDEAFDGTIERVDVGDYGMLITGSGDDDSGAIGVFLSGGRAVMVLFEIKGNEYRGDAVRQMTMATMLYLERMYTTGPGTFTVVTEKATAASAATLVMLTTAGIAVSLAQAIAGAVGQAVQTTSEMTAQAVTDAMADARGNGLHGVNTDSGDGSSEPVPPPEPPPPALPQSAPKGPTLYDKEGEAFARSDDGRYWAPDDEGNWGWRDESEARKSSAALRQEKAQRASEQEHHQRETERMTAESREGIQARNQAEEAAFRQRQHANALAEKLADNRNRRVADLLRKRAAEHGGEFKQEVDDLLASNNTAGLEDLLRDRLQSEVATGQATSAAEENWASAMAVGEGFSRATLAASKGALMAVGGPSGAIATGMAVGTVSAAEAGAESAVKGDSFSEFTRKTAVGFMSGAKDGAVSVYTNLPGTGKMAKLLVPAGTDSLETFVRTGDGRQALVSGVSSLAGDLAGGKIDAFGNVIGREIGSAAVTVASAEAANYANGGQFGEAYQGALINHLGGKVGGRLGTMGASHSSDPEQRINAALNEMHSGPGEIPLEGQAAIVQQLNGTRHKAVLLDSFGKPRFDSLGNPMTTELVNTKGALTQLQDTAASRTAKKAPWELREAIIATRREKIYNPADTATINKVTPLLQKEGMLRQGDTVEMDTFSTPGSKPSLGADRDARLVIKRPRKPDLAEVEARLTKENSSLLKKGDSLEIDTSGRKQDGMPPGADPADKVFVRRADGEKVELDRKQWESFDRIEVDRKHWERTALKDFYDHTMGIARSDGGEISRETQPEFFRRRDELEFMRRPETPEAVAALKKQGYSDERIAKMQEQGLSQEQIDHQAWAEAHNQLFTDRHHMEASRDNADQSFGVMDGRPEPIQKTSNIVDVQKGKTDLADAEGFGRMWSEKSSFYAHNKPEALAQSQKGIAGYMKVRKGYRALDMEPPPITDRAASAMEIVAKAPVGVDATPEAMAKVESDLQGLGYRDMNDALTKIAQHHEQLKWSTNGNASASVRGLGTSDLSRIARGGGSLLWEDKLDKE